MYMHAVRRERERERERVLERGNNAEEQPESLRTDSCVCFG